MMLLDAVVIIVIEPGILSPHSLPSSTSVISHHSHHLSPVAAQVLPKSKTTSPQPDDSTTSYETMLPVSTLSNLSNFKQEGTIFVDDHTEDYSVVEDCTADNSIV